MFAVFRGELLLLVLESCLLLAKSGEIYLLDMGEPIKICRFSKKEWYAFLVNQLSPQSNPNGN